MMDSLFDAKQYEVWTVEMQEDFAACAESFVDPADLVWDDFDSEEA